jgi:hypothetical protein
MRHHRLALFTAAAIAVAPFSPTPAYAVPAPARGVAPADVAAPAVVKHVSTDVDGDGTRDSVSLTYLGSSQFALTATTTKGKSSTVTFTSRVDAKWAPAADTWYGASAIDGHKGSELIANRFTKSTAESRKNVSLGVYTWRSGKLVASKAPASRWGKAWKVNATLAGEARGYNFFTKSGHRYVDATRMTTGKYTRPWNGYVTRSVWRSGKWVKLWTHKAKTVKSSALSAWGQVGIAGPNLLLGQVSVDVDGDARADLVGYYRDGLDLHMFRVATAAGRTVYVGYQTEPDSAFIGAAQLDGVAGDELIAEVGSEGPVWTVFTWADYTLRETPMPALYGETGGSIPWQGHSDEAITNLRFYNDAGASYVETGWIWFENSITTDPVNFATSVWQDGKWVKKSEQQRVLTDAERATFHSGFTVDGLVTP